MPEDTGSERYAQARFRRPPGSTELLIVRHGESEPADPARPFPLVDGQGDPALAPAGRAQAALVAERLAGEPIAAIYVTSLRRTHETAAPLAARLGLTPIVEADLREVHLGEFEGGAYRKHVAEGHPIIARMFEAQRWDVIPGAEPADVFATRVNGAVARIASRHPDQTVAVFVHGGTIGQILAAACGATHGFAFVGSDNGAISHLVVAGERWIIRRYNDTAHLTSAFTEAPQPLT